ncbi:MAG: hypothetical protein A4E30_00850 [Methanomassiliicoccales archaeon PtaB.Bin215]|nr:MAG: hypothetical protein A4E30_00850 [Methanomassiliicoccales archaeon PtaB.Bin215]
MMLSLSISRVAIHSGGSVPEAMVICRMRILRSISPR